MVMIRHHKQHFPRTFGPQSRRQCPSFGLLLVGCFALVQLSGTNAKSVPSDRLFHNEVVQDDKTGFQCAIYSQNEVVQDDVKRVQHCQYCYAFWNLQQRIPMQQGCLDEDYNEQCSDDESCLVKEDEDLNISGSGFCCCKGDFCNDRFRVESKEVLSTPLLLTLIVLSSLMLVGLVSLFTAALRRQRLAVKNGPYCIQEPQTWNCDSDISSLSSKIPLISQEDQCHIDLSNLQVDNVIMGRDTSKSIIYNGFFTSLDGSLNKVAVKVHESEKNFQHEKKCYELRQLVRAGSQITFPLLCAKDELDIQGVRYENVLLFPLASNGSLSKFLKANEVSWAQMMTLMRSISIAVANVHSLTRMTKISHGDIHPGHILITEDLTCRLCDLSTMESGQEHRIDGQRNYRYLAPEMLGNALRENRPRRSHSGRQEADVYSTALVFWEIAMRCQDLFQGVQIPSYEMAFQKELGGQEPTLEKMHVLVSQNGARPLFPDVWKRSNPAIRLLKETLENSWDQEKEARLTSVCVTERIREISDLWEKFHSQNKLQNNNSNQIGGINDGNNSAIPNSLSTQVFLRNDEVIRTNLVRNTSGTLSGRAGKNSNISSQEVQCGRMFQLQPHQGRNPCLERNFNTNVNDDGNIAQELVEKSVKETFSSQQTEPMPAENQNSLHSYRIPQTQLGQPLPHSTRAVRFVQNDLRNPRQKDKNKERARQAEEAH